MNFEKWMKKRGNNKLNAYAKNPYHVSWIKRIPMWSKIVVPTALAMTAAVVVISVGVLPSLAMNKGASKAPQSNADYASKPVQTSKDNQQPGSQAQSTVPGESISDRQTTFHFKYQDISYDLSTKTLDKTKGLSLFIDQKIATISLEDINQQLKQVDLYSFKNIDEEVAIAASDDNSNVFSIYFNNSCHFHDIDDFVDLLSPATEIKIQKILYYDLTISDDKQAQYLSSSDTEIYDILFADGSIEGYTAIDYDYESSYKYYYLGLNIAAFNDFTFSTYFYDSGYIVFNFLDQNHIFELGQETYQAFAAYLENYKTSN